MNFFNNCHISLVRRISFSICFFFIFGCAQTQELAGIEGKVAEELSGEPVIFATVALYQEGELIKGLDTDFDGRFAFSELSEGSYDLEISFLGYTSAKVLQVEVEGTDQKELMIILKKEKENQAVTIYNGRLIAKNKELVPDPNIAEYIRSLPVINLSDIQTANDSITPSNEDISIGAGRGTPTEYYINGKKVSPESVKNYIRKDKKQKKRLRKEKRLLRKAKRKQQRKKN